MEYEDLLQDVASIKSKSAFQDLNGKDIFIEQQTKRVLELCFPFLLERAEALCHDLIDNYLHISIEPAAESVGALIAKDDSAYEWFRHLVFYKKNQQVKTLNLFIIKIFESENKYYIINKS